MTITHLREEDIVSHLSKKGLFSPGSFTAPAVNLNFNRKAPRLPLAPSSDEILYTTCQQSITTGGLRLEYNNTAGDVMDGRRGPPVHGPGPRGRSNISFRKIDVDKCSDRSPRPPEGFQISVKINMTNDKPFL